MKSIYENVKEKILYIHVYPRVKYISTTNMVLCGKILS